MWILLAIIIVGILWSVWGYFSSRVEQTDYSVTAHAKGYEVRQYPAHLVAQTTVQGSYKEAVGTGFRIIAGYIFGDNTKKQSIAMTAPVVAQGEVSEKIAMTAPVVASPTGGAYTISFGMPRGLTLETLPVPNDARVKLVELPARKVAARQYAGWRTNAREKGMEDELLQALSRDGHRAISAPAYAGYNAPWTPPWMQRHEVLVDIA
jgi:hypothetical protein